MLISSCLGFVCVCFFSQLHSNQTDLRTAYKHYTSYTYIYIYMIFFYDTIHASFVWFCIIPKLSTFLFPKNSGSFSWGKLNGNLSSKPFNLPNKQLGMKVAIRFRLWWRNHGKPCKWFKGSWVYVVPPYGTTKNYPAQNTRNLVDGYCSHLLLLFFVALFFFCWFLCSFLFRKTEDGKWMRMIYCRILW